MCYCWYFSSIQKVYFGFETIHGSWNLVEKSY